MSRVQTFTARPNGSTSFFVAAVILPLAFFLFSLSVDLSMYFSERERWQKAADEGVLYGERFLPDQAQAKKGALTMIAARAGSGADVQVSTNPDRLAVDIAAQFKLLFARYFGISTEIPIVVHSVGRSPVYDVVIGIDNGAAMGPTVPGGAPWADEALWPAAQYFSYDRSFYLDGQPIDPRLITQLCFNPIFSAVKQTAIGAFDYLATFPSTRIGLVFSPGAAGGIEWGRPLSAAGPLSGESGEVRWLGYNGRYSGDLFCAAAAERETEHTLYLMPEQGRYGAAFAPGSGASFVDPLTGDISAERRDALRARELIWSRAVNADRISDTAELLRAVGGELARRTPSSSVRGGLENRASQLGAVFLSDLPTFAGVPFPAESTESELVSVFSQLREQSAERGGGIRIVLAIAPPPERLYLAAYQQGVERLAEFLREQSGPGLELRLVSAGSPDDLERQLAGVLVRGERRAMVAE